MKLLVKNTKKISGIYEVSGSKNATLAFLCLSLLTKEKIILKNIPLISDVFVFLEILEDIGICVNLNKDTHTLILQRKKLKRNIANPLMKNIRASIYLLGAYFSLKKQFNLYVPGGCAFQDRPIDYHLDAFKKMGASIKEKDDKIYIKRKNKKAVSITLVKKSLGTTINIIYGSILTKGTTIIHNASLEPEVISLIDALNKMDADIKIINDSIYIIGKKKLKHLTYHMICDRIEAGSVMLLASSASKANLLIKNIKLEEVKSICDVLVSSGIKIIKHQNALRIIKDNKNIGAKIITNPYPSFPTDLQQVSFPYLLSATSISYVKDNIYDNRFTQINELNKMGAIIYKRKHEVLIFPSTLIGTTVYAHDLRCGYSLIIAGCIAEKDTIISNAEVILRGYENIVAKLQNIGIDITEISK